MFGGELNVREFVAVLKRNMIVNYKDKKPEEDDVLLLSSVSAFVPMTDPVTEVVDDSDLMPLLPLK